MLTLDDSSVVNADDGMISVSAQISWTASSMPNGVITSHSVTILNNTGTVVLSVDSLAETATGHTVTATLVPNRMYFATVEVFNGAGSSEANSISVLSPQGSKTMVLCYKKIYENNVIFCSSRSC